MSYRSDVLLDAACVVSGVVQSMLNIVEECTILIHINAASSERSSLYPKVLLALLVDHHSLKGS